MTDLDDGRYVGRQIRSYRRVRNYTQQQLADFVGLSRTAVTMYETGERPVDSRELLYAFAHALQVSVGDLTGHADDKVNPSVAVFHAAIPGIEAALMSAGDVDDQTDPATLDRLVRDVDRALELRSANDYAMLGTLLPNLITDLYRRTSTEGGWAHQTACEALATVAFVAASATKGLGYTSLSWNAAQAGHDAAAAIGYPAGIAAAEFARSQVLLATPRSLTAALTHAEATADHLQGDLRRPFDLEMYGMLHLQAALTAAALGKEPEPHLLEAAETAKRSGDGSAFGLHFGPANVTIWEMSVALEQRRGGKALELARDLEPDSIPSADRQSRYFIEVGRAHAIEGGYQASMHALLRAEHIAPQKVRSRTVVRELVGHMLRRARRDLVSGELGRLAKRVGATVS